MNEQDRGKLGELVEVSIKLGYNMGVTSMRVSLMESLAPYIDGQILQTELFTSRDVMQLVLDALTEFDSEAEYESMRKIAKLPDSLG